MDTTLEKIQARRALLNSMSGSATSMGHELLRPAPATEDPATDKGTKLGAVWSFLFGHYGAGQWRETERMYVTAHRVSPSLDVTRAHVVVAGTGLSPAIFSSPHPSKIEDLAFGCALATYHVIDEDSPWLGARYVVDTASVDEPLSPFEQIKAYPYTQIELLIECIGNVYQISYAKALRGRLTELVASWREEHEIEGAPSPDSLSGLLRFLTSDSGIQFPSIVLSPQGTWVAEWRLDARNLFSAHFLEEANARFVAVVSPGKSSRRRPNKVWGEIEVGKLLLTARTYGAERWMRK